MKPKFKDIKSKTRMSAGRRGNENGGRRMVGGGWGIVKEGRERMKKGWRIVMIERRDGG